MNLIKRETIQDLALAVLLWTALAFGLMWHRLAMLDRASGPFPMPVPESLAAFGFHYFSAVPLTGRAALIRWELAVPLAGLLWTAALTLTAPFFNGRRAVFGYTCLRMGLAALPTAAIGPWMAYVAGTTSAGFVWGRMTDVLLGVAPMPAFAWLHPLYAALSALTIAIQVRICMVAFDLKGLNLARHYLVSAALAGLVACGAGALAAAPLRGWLE